MVFDKKGKAEEAKVDVPLNLNEVMNRLGNYPIEHVYSFEQAGLVVNGTLPPCCGENEVVEGR